MADFDLEVKPYGDTFGVFKTGATVPRWTGTEKVLNSVVAGIKQQEKHMRRRKR